MYKEANFPGFAFLSTLSLRRATTVTARIIDPTYDFYPRSPCGERRGGHICKASGEYFYPRSPCGERQRAEHHASSQQEFLSTLSLRRATYLINTYHRIFGISIHALLAESDLATWKPDYICRISIHALLAESDPGRIWSTAFA